MKNLNEIITNIQDISKNHPVMQDRIEALKQAGYEKIHYVYIKQGRGLFGAMHLTKRKLYRIQIGNTELQKGYPAAWCIDVSSTGVLNEIELPF